MRVQGAGDGRLVGPVAGLLAIIPRRWPLERAEGFGVHGALKRGIPPGVHDIVKRRHCLGCMTFLREGTSPGVQDLMKRGVQDLMKRR